MLDEDKLAELATDLDVWQRQIFNAAHKGCDRVGLTSLSSDMRDRLLELRIMLGHNELQEKHRLGIPMSEDERRKLSVAESTGTLRKS